MKRLLSVFLFLFCCVIAADAQDDAAQYDSIMNLMKNKKIPLMERYYMTRISNIFHGSIRLPC